MGSLSKSPMFALKCLPRRMGTSILQARNRFLMLVREKEIS